MIDLTNKYVPNVDSELRDLWIAECKRQGYEQCSGVTLTCHDYLMVNNEYKYFMNCEQKDLEEYNLSRLSLDDFKPAKSKHPKKTKQIKVDCNFKSFYEALEEMKRVGGKYYNKLGKVQHNTNDNSFYYDTCLKFLQDNYKDLYRVEVVEDTQKQQIEDFIENSEHLGVYSDFEDYVNEDEDFRREFEELCKLIIESSDHK